MDRQEQPRYFCFKTTLKYFRTLSGEGTEAGNLASLGDAIVGAQIQLFAPNPTQEGRRDSAYSSDSELQGEKDDSGSHWWAMGLEDFTTRGGQYVDLFRSQLSLLRMDCSQQNVLRFASIQAYVQDVPTDPRDTKHSLKTEPLFLTPDTFTGELHCDKRQLLAGPYNPVHLSGLEVNYVLYSSSQGHDKFPLRSLEVILFSPKFKHNYVLALEADPSPDNKHPPDRVGVKFKPIELHTPKVPEEQSAVIDGSQPEWPSIHCTPEDPNTGGPYNISIEAYGHTYWLYLECTDVNKSRVVVKAFREDSSTKQLAKAKFNFQTAQL